MPMFIITGSMITAAIWSPNSDRPASRASASLNGATRVSVHIDRGMPLEVGTVV